MYLIQRDEERKVVVGELAVGRREILASICLAHVLDGPLLDRLLPQRRLDGHLLSRACRHLERVQHPTIVFLHLDGEHARLRDENLSGHGQRRVMELPGTMDAEHLVDHRGRFACVKFACELMTSQNRRTRTQYRSSRLRNTRQDDR
jgi:hypothetical protein